MTSKLSQTLKISISKYDRNTLKAFKEHGIAAQFRTFLNKKWKNQKEENKMSEQKWNVIFLN